VFSDYDAIGSACLLFFQVLLLRFLAVSLSAGNRGYVLPSTIQRPLNRAPLLHCVGHQGHSNECNCRVLSREVVCLLAIHLPYGKHETLYHFNGCVTLLPHSTTQVYIFRYRLQLYGPDNPTHFHVCVLTSVGLLLV
jgi:hypothetical protein